MTDLRISTVQTDKYQQNIAHILTKNTEALSWGRRSPLVPSWFPTNSAGSILHTRLSVCRTSSLFLSKLSETHNWVTSAMFLSCLRAERKGGAFEGVRNLIRTVEFKLPKNQPASAVQKPNLSSDERNCLWVAEYVLQEREGILCMSHKYCVYLDKGVQLNNMLGKAEME